MHSSNSRKCSQYQRGRITESLKSIRVLLTRFTYTEWNPKSSTTEHRIGTNIPPCTIRNAEAYSTLLRLPTFEGSAPHVWHFSNPEPMAKNEKLHSTLTYALEIINSVTQMVRSTSRYAAKQKGAIKENKRRIRLRLERLEKVRTTGEEYCTTKTKNKQTCCMTVQITAQQSIQDSCVATDYLQCVFSSRRILKISAYVHRRDTKPTVGHSLAQRAKYGTDEWLRYIGFITALVLVIFKTVTSTLTSIQDEYRNNKTPRPPYFVASHHASQHARTFGKRGCERENVKLDGAKTPSPRLDQWTQRRQKWKTKIIIRALLIVG